MCADIHTHTHTNTHTHTHTHLLRSPIAKTKPAMSAAWNTHKLDLIPRHFFEKLHKARTRVMRHLVICAAVYHQHGRYARLVSASYTHTHTHTYTYTHTLTHSHHSTLALSELPIRYAYQACIPAAAHTHTQGATAESEREERNEGVKATGGMRSA